MSTTGDDGTRRIYLAARYSRHPEMRGYADDLRRMGYTVTARWILGDHDLRSKGQSDADAWTVRWAQEDWDDLIAADCVISFTEGPGDVPGRARGGRHVEFGAALALGKRCIVVGPRENVFHHLPGIELVPDWAMCLHILRLFYLGSVPAELLQHRRIQIEEQGRIVAVCARCDQGWPCDEALRERRP